MKLIVRCLLVVFNFFILVTITPISIKAATQNSIPILMYHYIGDNPNPADKDRNALSTTTDLFQQQMDYLEKNGYTPIDLDTLYGIFNGATTAPAKPVVLTFDDGYIDFYLIAFPILKQHNFKATVFIPTGLVGGGYYMNWDQLRELNKSGLISLESHAVTHKSLSSQSFTKALEELKTSKTILEKETGATVHFIAYPNGAPPPAMGKALKDAGYSGGIGTWAGRATGPGTNISRLRINGETNLNQFIKQIGK